MLIDFHTHAQPSVEAAAEFYRMLGVAEAPNSGAPEELFAHMARLGVARTLIVPWLPAQHLVEDRVAGGEARTTAAAAVLAGWSALNAWAAAAAAGDPDRLSSLVGVDPLLMSPEQVEAEIEQRLAQGACGIKIAPKFLGLRPDDPRMRPVWALAARHGVFVLSESSALPGFGREPFGHPAHFESVLAEWPTVRIMLAHLGRGAEGEVARLARRYRNLYTDLSYRMGDLDAPGGWSSADLVTLIRDIGSDRVVYGTNYPMADVDAYAAAFAKLALTDEERAQIGWKNAEFLRKPVDKA